MLQLVQGRLPLSARQAKIETLRPVDPTGQHEAARSRMTFIILLLGLGVGVLVGLLGVGGGAVLVPAMVYLLHLDQHMAQGTSLFILLPPLGLGALREYWKQGQVDWRAGMLCALGMLLGGYAGSLVALPMPSRILEGLFGCFLMLAAMLLWGKSHHENVPSKRGREPDRG
ncbi:MAG TPA: sulfite exporter TauE/SafE family protein [Candidatus Udaeobacter sp.]|nr:sulfite exporter TauE/SafE family protein [Candidatus Udaeobacter sp.]